MSLHCRAGEQKGLLGLASYWKFDRQRTVDLAGELAWADGQDERVGAVVMRDVVRLALGMCRGEHQDARTSLARRDRYRQAIRRSERAVEQDEAGVHTADCQSRRFAIAWEFGRVS